VWSETKTSIPEIFILRRQLPKGDDPDQRAGLTGITTPNKLKGMIWFFAPSDS
jgi:hypothetical protein